MPQTVPTSSLTAFAHLLAQHQQLVMPTDAIGRVLRTAKLTPKGGTDVELTLGADDRLRATLPPVNDLPQTVHLTVSFDGVSSIVCDSDGQCEATASELGYCVQRLSEAIARLRGRIA